MHHRHPKEKKLTYGIIGLGRFGTALALELYKKGAEMIIVDSHPERIRWARELTENAYIVNSFDYASLRKIGIQNCDIAVVCIGKHIDDSIMITLDLVTMKIPQVFAKAQNDKHGIILEKLGAHVVYPEREMALRLASYLENTRTLDYVRLSKKVNITKVKVTEQSDNKTILDLKIRNKFGCNIIAIEHNGKVYDVVTPDTKLFTDDIIYVTGSEDRLDKLIKAI
ncbi:MAG: TrkA family potassium uptake protein [Bacilli bacterium]|nr:TrkA family potassium uptake protein [Bacilli bacterium]